MQLEKRPELVVGYRLQLEKRPQLVVGRRKGIRANEKRGWGSTLSLEIVKEMTTNVTTNRNRRDRAVDLSVR